MQHDGCSKEGRGEDQGDVIPLFVAQGLHLRAAGTAVVAARLHGHRKIICPAKGRYEKRNEQRNHIFHLRNKVSGFKIGAARNLGLHDFIGFFHKNRYEAKCNGHHHRNFVDRNMDNFQGSEKAFHAVRERVRRRRKRHDGGTDDKIGEAQAHTYSQDHAFIGNRKNPPVRQNRARRQENIEGHRDE